MKKIKARSRVRRRPVSLVKRKSAGAQSDADIRRRLEDLCEQIDIVLPEVTARVAALEHLLLKKELCTREDLRGAREFVRMQEA